MFISLLDRVVRINLMVFCILTKRGKKSMFVAEVSEFLRFLKKKSQALKNSAF